MHPGRPELTRHRDLWAVVNERFTDAAADGEWAAEGIRWGLFRRARRRVGAARRRPRTRRGRARLRHRIPVGRSRPRRCPPRRRGPQPCPAGDGATMPAAARRVLPIGGGRRRPGPPARRRRSTSSSASTAPPPGAILPSGSRRRRGSCAPTGRLVFLTHSVTVALCVPEAGGVAGDRLLRAQRDAGAASLGRAVGSSTIPATATGSACCGPAASRSMRSTKSTRRPAPTLRSLTLTSTRSSRPPGPPNGRLKTRGWRTGASARRRTRRYTMAPALVWSV